MDFTTKKYSKEERSSSAKLHQHSYFSIKTYNFKFFIYLKKMGQKMNPSGIRVMENFCGDFISGTFSNYWFSDFKYSSLFFNDVSISKNSKRIFMKYYKTRARFIKGRRRRLKSILRTNSKSFLLLRLPYKMILLNSFYKPAQTGLQRKHTVFFIKKRKTNSIG